MNMDSNKIIEFLKLFKMSDFLGVFAVDELALIPKRRTGLVIFNTDNFKVKRFDSRTGEDGIAFALHTSFNFC